MTKIIHSRFLSELKNQVIEILYNWNDENVELCLLLDYDGSIIKIFNCFEETLYIQITSFVYIALADKEGNDKFYSYLNQHKINPEFKGDSEKDKGYTFIKRREKK